MASRKSSNQPLRPATRDDFHVALLCAKPLEADAVEAIFDLHWEDHGLSFDKTPGDPNAYSTGVIGRHNVVLAHMPDMGVVNAASVASACKTSFPNIRLGLVVGICGVVPGDDDDERVLGDVIISNGVVQYDFGRQIDRYFKRKDTLRESLGRPPAELRSLLAKLCGVRGLAKLKKRIAGHLSDLQAIPELYATYPGKAHDKLFKPDYTHVDKERTCDELGCCGTLVPRKRLLPELDEPTPGVHFGLIASGNTVMKSGIDRDRIVRKEGVVAFEMEGAGAWDTFPCLVIKGACDYADSHKNKVWQRYAAAAAAACTKAFLQEWVPAEAATQGPEGPWFLVPHPENEGFVQRVSYLETLISHLGFGTDAEKLGARVALYGLGGVGKTQIALSYTQWLQKTCPDVSVFWAHANSAERFLESYRTIARECKISGYDDPQAETLSLVKSWLEQTDRGRWLMVIDNADNTELFAPSQEEEDISASAHAIGRGKIGRFVPSCRHGSVLITSRNKQTAVRLVPGKHQIEVGKMTDTGAMKLARSTMEAVTNALGILLAFSFVLNGRKEAVDIHRLVQLITRKWLYTGGNTGNFALDALKVVSNAFPFGRFEHQDMCLRYLQNAHAVLAVHQEDANLPRALLLNNMGGLFVLQGRWSKAETCLVQACTILAQVLGEEHTRTLSSKRNLATIYETRGRWKEAESLQVRVMETEQRERERERERDMINARDV